MINVECKVLVIRFSNIPGSNVLVVKFEAFFFTKVVIRENYCCILSIIL